jgi:Raf kinase inhibitor-like YbhB/YbcL family protein
MSLGACAPAPAAAPPSEGAAATPAEPRAEPTSGLAAATASAAPTALPAEDFILRSPAFADGAAISVRYTCDGDNLSPPLEWTGVPQGAGALMLIAYDPDAGRDLGASTDLGFIHWVVIDLPATSKGLPEGASSSREAILGAMEAANDFSGAAGSTFPGGAAVRGVGYDGPCPPAQHRYVFRLLALDGPLGLAGGTAAADAITAAQGRLVGVADWTGSYGGAR